MTYQEQQFGVEQQYYNDVSIAILRVVGIFVAIALLVASVISIFFVQDGHVVSFWGFPFIAIFAAGCVNHTLRQYVFEVKAADERRLRGLRMLRVDLD